MRKALVMFLIIGLLAFIVACNPDSSLNEELVNVTISSRDTRALEASTNFSISDVTTWKYTAEKADNGLKTGATTEQVELIDGKTQQLSQGSWNFKLFGYNNEGNLICVGEAPNTTITVEKHIISILVGPQQKGMGRIVIKDDISIVDKNGNPVVDATKNPYEKSVSVYALNGENPITEYESVKSGVYYVKVVYTAEAKDGTRYEAASAKKYFNVYDNLTTTVFGTVEETTQAGEANPEDDKIVASVGGKLYTNIEDALQAATKETPLILTSDATLHSFISLSKSSIIDLNGNTLSTEDVSITLPKSDEKYTVTIKNGSIKGKSSPNKDKNIFQQESNSNLVIENVRIEHQGQAVAFIYEGTNPAYLEIKNSVIHNEGGYVIGTNASLKGAHVSINIDASELTSTSSSQDNTAILFNVPGELKITNSTISGQRQGVIVRGSTAYISNSLITSSGSATNYYNSNDYVDGPWDTGNEVPLAAIVIGNRTKNSDSYPYPTTVTLDNVTLSTPNESNVRKSLYVYQNNENYKVKVTGTVKGEYTVNSITNGAEVLGTEEKVIGENIESENFNDALKNANNSTKFILPSANITLNLNNGVCNGGENSKKITFIGKLDSDNKPLSTIDVVAKAVSAEGGMLNYQRGSSFTFENLTIQAGEGNFDGIVCDELTYKNCVIKGKLTLFGKATFIDCTFDNDMDNQYSIWTWGGTDVKFENCTFNTNGKAILLYGRAKENGESTNLTVNNCVFNDSNNGSKGKAAIEIGNDYNATYTLNISNATVDGFAKGKNTGSILWANKDGMDDEHLSVIINGEKKSTDEFVTYVAKNGCKRYVRIDDAINASGKSEKINIELLNDGELPIGATNEHPLGTEETKKITITGVLKDGKKPTLSMKGTNSDWSFIQLKNENAELEINNVVLKKTGYGAESGPWNNHDLYFDCKVDLTDVTSLSAIALRKDTNLKNVEISDKNTNQDTYMLWICENGQTVNIDGCTIDGTSGCGKENRAIALKDQYEKNPQTVTLNIKDTKIYSDKYAAVLVTTKCGGNISFDNVDISGTKDTTNGVWSDVDLSKLTLNGCTAKKR